MCVRMCVHASLLCACTHTHVLRARYMCDFMARLPPRWMTRMLRPAVYRVTNDLSVSSEGGKREGGGESNLGEYAGKLRTSLIELFKNPYSWSFLGDL